MSKKYSKYKNLVINTYGYECSECNLTEWRNKSLSLELDHIDGNNKNNELNNLRLLCPNCHSQTDTFRGKNVNTGFKEITDDILLSALQDTNNIRQALIKVGLTPKGENYTRASNLLNLTYTKIIDIHNSQYGSIWINNGIHNKKIKKDQFVEYESLNWKLGRIVLNKTPSAKGKIWITNGIISKFICNANIIPDNWWRGRCKCS